MRRQVDIAEVEQATKIRAKYLRALENEEFELLPGPTFVRSFLKTYADHLGLDARRLVEEYRTSYEGLPEEEPPPALAPGRPPRGRETYRYERRPLPTGLIVAGGVVGLLLLFLVLGLTGGGGRPPEAGDGKQAADRGQSAPKPHSRAAPARPKRPKTVVLRVSPVESTYVCVDRGPGQAPVYEGSLSSARTFRGKRLRINLGRPSARLTANGKRVKLGTTTQSVGLAFAPGKRARPLAPGQRPCSSGAGGAGVIGAAGGTATGEARGVGVVAGRVAARGATGATGAAGGATPGA
jgi:cytoskeleton protein RodZ